MRGRSNGIEVKVISELRQLRNKFKEDNNVKVRKSEVVVRYDTYQEFQIANKERTNESLYPSKIKGNQIIRPLGDLKCIMFNFNGEVFARFHHNIIKNKKYTDIKIGRIVNDTLKFA